MKVGELREKLAKLKKEEIVKIASEFYKLIPKAKKEDYNVDELVNNPDKKKTSKTKTKLSLTEIVKDVETFIANAKEQYYLAPNRVVPKKERSTWRFNVKRWYKELTNLKRHDVNVPVQAKALADLYELLCESCGYQYFTAYDTFESTGITQDDFYKAVIMLLQEAEGKRVSLEKCISLVVDNYLNRYTLHSELMVTLLPTLTAPSLREEGVKIVKQLIRKNNYVHKPRVRKFFYDSSDMAQFRIKEKHNDLAEFGYRFHISLHEIDEAISFFKKYYNEENKEIKLYVLIRLLIGTKKAEVIKREIESAIQEGVEPRKRLMEVLSTINETNEVPQYL